LTVQLTEEQAPETAHRQVSSSDRPTSKTQLE
jgi:hypothetical protein